MVLIQLRSSQTRKVVNWSQRWVVNCYHGQLDHNLCTVGNTGLHATLYFLTSSPTNGVHAAFCQTTGPPSVFHEEEKNPSLFNENFSFFWHSRQLWHHPDAGSSLHCNCFVKGSFSELNFELFRRIILWFHYRAMKGGFPSQYFTEYYPVLESVNDRNCSRDQLGKSSQCQHVFLLGQCHFTVTQPVQS